MIRVKRLLRTANDTGTRFGARSTRPGDTPIRWWDWPSPSELAPELLDPPIDGRIAAIGPAGRVPAMVAEA